MTVSEVIKESGATSVPVPVGCIESNVYVFTLDQVVNLISLVRKDVVIHQ